MCTICQRIKKTQNGTDPLLIHEFKHSYFVLGDHQYYKGYSQLIFKEHIRDITDLDLQTQQEFFAEVMTAAKALKKVCTPYRFNYSCLGNVVEHIHFHIFPRYPSDLKEDHQKNPWSMSEHFHEFPTIAEDEKILINKLKNILS